MGRRKKATEPDRFPPELFARLRELRKKAGLTQAEVARRMGKPGKTGRSLVSMLEAGQIPNPTIGRIGDHLRACQSSFDEVVQLLNRYTSRKTVIDEQGRKGVEKSLALVAEPVKTMVLNYDAKTAVADRFEGRNPLEPETRVMRARKLAAAWIFRERLEARMAELFHGLDTYPALATRKFLAEHGRKVWGILRRTRKDPGRLRPGKLDRALQWAIEQKIAAEPAVRRIHEAVVELFGRMERAGELDVLPAYAGRRRMPRGRIIRAEDRRAYELQEQEKRRQDEVMKIRDRMFAEVEPELATRGVDPNRRLSYRIWCGRLLKAFIVTEQDLALRRRRMDELIAETSKPDEAGAIAALFLAAYDKHKAALPPPLPPDQR